MESISRTIGGVYVDVPRIATRRYGAWSADFYMLPSGTLEVCLIGSAGYGASYWGSMWADGDGAAFDWQVPASIRARAMASGRRIRRDMVRHDPIMWANGSGVWHAAVTPGPDAAARAHTAIRGALIDHEEIPAWSPHRVIVEQAAAWIQSDRTDGRIVYVEHV